MLWLSFALTYLTMLTLSLAMSRHHKLLFSGAPSTARSRALRLVACLVGAVALGVSIAAEGGEIGTIVWLGQLMLSGLLLVGLMAWRQRWALPLAAILPAGALLQLLA